MGKTVKWRFNKKARALTFAVGLAAAIALPNVLFEYECENIVNYVSGSSNDVSWQSKQFLEEITPYLKRFGYCVFKWIYLRSAVTICENYEERRILATLRTTLGYM